MSAFFLGLVNRSIAAGWLIAAVAALRLVLKKAPRQAVCLLWALVAVRLICPVSLESVFSLIPSAETISAPAAWSDEAIAGGGPLAEPVRVQSGISAVDQAVNPMLAQADGSGLRLNIHILAGAWLVGMLGLFLHAAVSFLRLKKRVSASIRLSNRIWICDEIPSPFILGVMRPRIYLPSGMEKEARRCVIAHEKTHLKRRDHWWKPLSYVLLAVYWFHPLVWLAYILFGRDVEMACDEMAVRSMGRKERAAYAQTLLDLSLPGRNLACPLAFGEVGVKERVKAVLRYKKPAFWLAAVSFIVCVAAAGCFLTNPKEEKEGEPPIETRDAGTEDEISAPTEAGPAKAKPMEAGTMQADPMPPQVTAETLFIEMPETFYFLSGAGAWQTELHLADDGSFTGRFEDADMGSYDEKRYPMGTVYVCDFSGVFVNPVQVDDYTWSVHVESLTYEEPGTETLEDGYLYITSGPYGLDNVDEVLVYLPGYPVAELSEEVFSWLRSGKEFWNGEGPDMLPFYALNNVNEQMGFFAPNEWP